MRRQANITPAHNDISPMSLPKIRTNSRGYCYVRIEDRDLYCGHKDDPATHSKYRAFVVEYLQTGRAPKTQAEQDQAITVSELAASYLRFAEDERTPTIFNNIRAVLRELCSMYGHLDAHDFGPKRLKIFRTWYAEQIPKNRKRTRTRQTVNHRMRLIMEAYQWAASEEMIDYYHADRLKSVPNLKSTSKTAARDSERRPPVPKGDIRRTLKELSPPLRGLVALQRLTGARPSELFGLRVIDLDMSSTDVWRLDLNKEGRSHKTQSKGKKRIILFGPRAQKIIRHFMKNRAITDPLFSPIESNAWYKSRRAKSSRRADQKPNTSATDRKIRPFFNKDSYCRAIVRACEKAGVPRWTPYQLRHNAATMYKSAGLDTARVVLGHSDRTMTERYGDEDRTEAIKAVKRLG